MKNITLVAIALVLSACTTERQAAVSDIDTVSGIVRLSYDKAVLIPATADNYTAHATATKSCQQLGYATAVPYGQPVTTCTLVSGSLCLNDTITLQYQCRGSASAAVQSLQY